MSFRYNGKTVNLGNYMSIFADLEPDMLDEIRSAVLDDTEIGAYITPCCNDNYKLGQFRLALREGVPSEYLNKDLSGSCIKLLRKLYRDNYSLKCIGEYVSNMHLDLDNEVLEQVLIALQNHAGIDAIDFRLVPPDKAKMICDGLIKGYPMWLFIGDSIDLSEDAMRHLLRALKLGIDIQPFLSGNWSESKISLLVSNARHLDIGAIMQSLTYKFSDAQIEEVLDCAKKGLDYTLLCLMGDDGCPMFSVEQMHVLVDSMADGVLNDEMYNPRISAEEMNRIRLEEDAKKGWVESPDGGFG